MKRKILYILLTLVAGFCTVFALAACDSSSCCADKPVVDTPADQYTQGLEYEEVDGGVAVSGIGTASGNKITLPAVINGKQVTAVKRGAFENNTVVKNVIVPDGVKVIGQDAFSGCTALTEITLPDSITEIGIHAFSGSELFADEETNWEDGALYLGKHLVSVKNSKDGAYTVAKGTLTIADGAFADCKLTGITLPDGVRTVGNFAFAGCRQLTSLLVPDSAQSIGNSAFQDCDVLSEITIGEGVKSIGSSLFGSKSAINNVFYAGDKAQWETVKKGGNNTILNESKLYFYSEERPEEPGNYWYYDQNGKRSYYTV